MKKWKKYLISLVYSVLGSLGLICLFNWYCMMVFNEANKYPYLYPACIIFGYISLLICIITLSINIEILIKSNLL